MHLYIANKCYSSWSLRPWMLLRAHNIPFDETVIPLDMPDTASRIRAISGSGRVPILVDGEAVVWESLAILEYLADKFADAGMWPAGLSARAHARAISSEMHAGFSALRRACPMNLGKRYAYKDRGAAVDADVARIEALWAEARRKFAGNGGPFLYGAFSAADAMYAPVVTRLDTYGFEVSNESRSYMQAVLGHPAFAEWRYGALQETWVAPSDEVDEEAVENFRPHLG